MKLDITSIVSKGRLAELAKQPRVARLCELWQKVSAETATDEERAEFAEMTQDVRDLDPNVLIDD